MIPDYVYKFQNIIFGNFSYPSRNQMSAYERMDGYIGMDMGKT